MVVSTHPCAPLCLAYKLVLSTITWISVRGNMSKKYCKGVASDGRWWVGPVGSINSGTSISSMTSLQKVTISHTTSLTVKVIQCRFGILLLNFAVSFTTEWMIAVQIVHLKIWPRIRGIGRIVVIAVREVAVRFDRFHLFTRGYKGISIPNHKVKTFAEKIARNWNFIPITVPSTFQRFFLIKHNHIFTLFNNIFTTTWTICEGTNKTFVFIFTEISNKTCLVITKYNKQHNIS